MKNELLDRGIILPSGEISKNKINLVAGAVTQPFAEMVWVTTGGDMETIDYKQTRTEQMSSANERTANSSSKHLTWTGSRQPYSSSALSQSRLNSCV